MAKFVTVDQFAIELLLCVPSFLDDAVKLDYLIFLYNILKCDYDSVAGGGAPGTIAVTTHKRQGNSTAP